MSNEEKKAAAEFEAYLKTLERDVTITNAKGESEVVKCSDEFSYKVPKGHADEGKEFTKSFSFPICETVEEAEKVIDGKGWNVLDMVNDQLKANARSNAYQLSLAAYKTTRTPEQLRADIIRDLVRAGISQTVAEAQVSSMFAAQ